MKISGRLLYVRGSGGGRARIPSWDRGEILWGWTRTTSAVIAAAPGTCRVRRGRDPSVYACRLWRVSRHIDSAPALPPTVACMRQVRESKEMKAAASLAPSGVAAAEAQRQIITECSFVKRKAQLYSIPCTFFFFFIPHFLYTFHLVPYLLFCFPFSFFSSVFNFHIHLVSFFFFYFYSLSVARVSRLLFVHTYILPALMIIIHIIDHHDFPPMQFYA